MCMFDVCMYVCVCVSVCVCVCVCARACLKSGSAKHISKVDLLRQSDVLPHWNRTAQQHCCPTQSQWSETLTQNCTSKLPPNPVTVIWNTDTELHIKVAVSPSQSSETLTQNCTSKLPSLPVSHLKHWLRTAHQSCPLTQSQSSETLTQNCTSKLPPNPVTVIWNTDIELQIKVAVSPSHRKSTSLKTKNMWNT